jgi:transcriptional regulator with XRE-family HTH domain
VKRHLTGNPTKAARGHEPTPDPHATRRLLAKHLRCLRTLRGWSQETLAEHAGLHRTYISGIERGERNLGLDNLDKLAQTFGITVADLLMGESNGRHRPQS